MEEVVLGEALDFSSAEKLAKNVAERRGSAILLAYYDKETGMKFPNVDCCGEKSWEVYAKSRGGNLRVVVGRFEFIFRVE